MIQQASNDSAVKLLVGLSKEMQRQEDERLRAIAEHLAHVVCGDCGRGVVWYKREVGPYFQNTLTVCAHVFRGLRARAEGSDSPIHGFTVCCVD